MPDANIILLSPREKTLTTTTPSEPIQITTDLCTGTQIPVTTPNDSKNHNYKIIGLTLRKFKKPVELFLFQVLFSVQAQAQESRAFPTSQDYDKNYFKENTEVKDKNAAAI